MGIIFISHSSKNNDAAMFLRDWLREQGYPETFLDLDPEHGLVPGARWEEELQKAGENCSALMVLLSPDWCASKWCFHEFKLAKILGKKIFPVLITPTQWSDIPVEITSQYQIADLSRDEILQDGLSRLAIGLKRAGLHPSDFEWPPAAEPARSPYRGLKALEEVDAAVFFGRDANIVDGLDRLRSKRSKTAKPVLAIAAASGAGKSSFLQAGLLSRLKRDEAEFIVLDTVRPGQDALSGAKGMLKALNGGVDAANPAAAVTANLEALRAQRFERLEKYSGENAAITNAPPPTFVLPIDQAEELFSSDNASGKTAIDLLAGQLAARDDILVVLTIRTDSLEKLQNSKLGDLLEIMNLPALHLSAFREVIEEPGKRHEPAITVEPQLTSKLIADLSEADALPLLAFTMERLVEEYGDDNLLELSEYEDGLGGVSGAIEAAVQTAYSKLRARDSVLAADDDLDAIARRAFIPWLVELDDVDAIPRRRVTDLSMLPGDTHALVRLFAEERLLIIETVALEGEAPCEVVQVSHEAVLRHWSALQRAIKEERGDLERLARVRMAANGWFEASDAAKSDLLVHKGEQLRLAEGLLQREDIARDLGDTGQAYLSACRQWETDLAAREARQERRSRFWRGVTMATAGCVVIVAIVGVGWSLWKTRQVNGQVADALVASSFSAADRYPPDTALRLALAAAQSSVLQPEGFGVRGAVVKSDVLTAEMHRFDHEGDVRGAELFAGETRLLTRSSDDSVRVFDLDTGAELHRFDHEGYVFSPELFARETRLLTWSMDGSARVFDLETGAELHRFVHEDSVLLAVLFAGETRLLTRSDDGSARVIDLETGEELHRFDHQMYGADPKLFAGGTRLLTWNVYDGARVFDLETGAELYRFDHEGVVAGAELFAGETRLLTLSSDFSARVFDLDTGEELLHVDLENYIDSAELFAGETRLLTWSEDGSVRVFDLETGTALHVFNHESDVYGAELFAGETRLLTWSRDGSARVFDLATGTEFQRFDHEDDVMGAELFAGETRLLTWSRDGSARVFDLETGEALHRFDHQGRVRGAQLFAGDTRLLTHSGDDYTRNDSAQVFDLETGTELRRFDHENDVYGAELFAFETRLLTWSEDNTARVFDLTILDEMLPAQALARDICSRKLLGTIDGQPASYITETDRQAAPILAATDIVDVCAPFR